jgi:DNA-binding response OmpR family regulator
MLRVLVVEDEPLIAMMIIDWLSELGFESVGPAGSIRAALKLLEAEAPDAAILDLTIGSEQSYPVAEVLAAAGIPFAFLTGRAADSIAPNFRDVLIVSKPFDFERIEGVMKQLLRPKQT